MLESLRTHLCQTLGVKEAFNGESLRDLILVLRFEQPVTYQMVADQLGKYYGRVDRTVEYDDTHFGMMYFRSHTTGLLVASVLVTIDSDRRLLMLCFSDEVG